LSALGTATALSPSRNRPTHHFKTEGLLGIRVTELSKRFGEFVAVDNVSFDIRPGELVAFLGPSGGGKSTILRIIAGLETADRGSVVLDGEVVDDVPVRQRHVGFVFQHYALFRHMTVQENIAYGLKVRGVAREERHARVDELLALMGLHGLQQRLPAQLSGGQRQRVALARSLAPKPRLLLLDEPFAAVDARVREELRVWLRRLHDEVHVTSIFVTHDQEEAFSLADRVLLINGGRLEQDGTPAEIFDNPANEFVARFVGDVNVLEATVQNGEARVGALRIPVKVQHSAPATRLIVRSHDLHFMRCDDGVATVRRVIALGDRVKVEAAVDGAGAIFAHLPRHSTLLYGIEPGARVNVSINDLRAYAAASNSNLNGH
jgi:sulfate transport system ATP-binding protein